MPASSNMTFLNAIHDTILMGVHQYKYKNGSFTDKIFRETPVVDAFNILIGSEETTSDEKAKFKAMLKICVDLRKRNISNPKLEDLLGNLQTCEAFGELFTNDAKARGIYVAPTTSQVMNEDGTVKETYVINDDGTRAVYQGGVVGVPPGAPDEWIKAQAKNTEILNEASKNNPAKLILGNRFRPEAIPSDPKKAGRTSFAASPTKTDSENDGKDSNVDFGNGFSANLRGAFK